MGSGRSGTGTGLEVLVTRRIAKRQSRDRESWQCTARISWRRNPGRAQSSLLLCGITSGYHAPYEAEAALTEQMANSIIGEYPLPPFPSSINPTARRCIRADTSTRTES